MTRAERRWAALFCTTYVVVFGLVAAASHHLWPAYEQGMFYASIALILSTVGTGEMAFGKGFYRD